MYFSMYWKLKFQISAHLKEKSRKIEKIFYGSQMFAENTLCLVLSYLLDNFTLVHSSINKLIVPTEHIISIFKKFFGLEMA